MCPKGKCHICKCLSPLQCQAPFHSSAKAPQPLLLLWVEFSARPGNSLGVLNGGRMSQVLNLLVSGSFLLIIFRAPSPFLPEQRFSLCERRSISPFFLPTQEELNQEMFQTHWSRFIKVYYSLFSPVSAPLSTCSNLTYP